MYPRARLRSGDAIHAGTETGWIGARAFGSSRHVARAAPAASRLSLSHRSGNADDHVDHRFGALHNFNMYAINSFLPAMIELRHHLDHSKAGLIAGIVLGAVGVVGMLGGGWLADLAQRSRSNGRLLVATAAMFLSAPLIYLGLNQPPGSIASFMIFTGAGVMFVYVYYASVYAAIQDVIEPGLRGTAMALYFFAMYLVGGAFGPSVMGKLSDVLSTRAMEAAGVTAAGVQFPPSFEKSDCIKGSTCYPWSAWG